MCTIVNISAVLIGYGPRHPITAQIVRRNRNNSKSAVRGMKGRDAAAVLFDRLIGE